MVVGDDLHLDVAGGRDVLLEEDRGVLEGGGGFRGGGAHGALEVLGGLDEADAAATTTGGGLHEEREADARGLGLRGLEVVEGDVVGAGDGGDAGVVHDLAGRDLAAEGAHGRGGRADEGDTGGGDGLSEVGVLGEEAVAGVDGVGAGGLRGLDDLVAEEVGLVRGAGAEADGVVSLADVEGVAVRIRVDGDGLNAHLAAGALHPERDFTTVGDEHSLEHARPVGGLFVVYVCVTHMPNHSVRGPEGHEADCHAGGATASVPGTLAVLLGHQRGAVAGAEVRCRRSGRRSAGSALEAWVPLRGSRRS